MKGDGRRQALRHWCPKCGAAPGDLCLGKRGERKAPHKWRFTAVGPESLPEVKKTPQRRRVGFYDTDEWRALRYQALKLHGGACQCCGAKGSRGHPLHVDHIKPRSKFRHLELELSNLQVLCEECNLGKSNTDQTDWRPQAMLA